MVKRIVSKAFSAITLLVIASTSVMSLAGVGLALNTGTAYASSYVFNTPSAVDYA